MDNVPIRHAAWIARCLGRGDLSPLGAEDIDALAIELGEARHAGGTTVFRMGELPGRVYIVRQGAVELTRELHGRRVTLQLLHPGDCSATFRSSPACPCPSTRERWRTASCSRSTRSRCGASRSSAPAWRTDGWCPSRCGWPRSRPGSRPPRRRAFRPTGVTAGPRGRARSGASQPAGPRRARRGPAHSVNRVLKDLEARQLIKLRYRQVEILDPAGLAALAGAATAATAPAA